jgi:hypothetical protein
MADDLKVFRRIPVLWQISREEVPEPESEAIEFELGRDMVGMFPCPG